MRRYTRSSACVDAAVDDAVASFDEAAAARDRGSASQLASRVPVIGAVSSCALAAVSTREIERVHADADALVDWELGERASHEIGHDFFDRGSLRARRSAARPRRRARRCSLRARRRRAPPAPSTWPTRRERRSLRRERVLAPWREPSLRRRPDRARSLHRSGVRAPRR